MPEPKRKSKPYAAVARAAVEIASILFLFYANLLMGEFTRANSHGKTLVLALKDIFTRANFLIGTLAALVGYIVFDRLRRQL
jgi:hypothetical protein